MSTCFWCVNGWNGVGGGIGYQFIADAKSGSECGSANAGCLVSPPTLPTGKFEGNLTVAYRNSSLSFFAYWVVSRGQQVRGRGAQPWTVQRWLGIGMRRSRGSTGCLCPMTPVIERALPGV